jgi:hypothetical protein
MSRKRLQQVLPIVAGAAVYAVLETVVAKWGPGSSFWSTAAEVVAVCVALVVALTLVVRRAGRY